MGNYSAQLTWWYREVSDSFLFMIVLGLPDWVFNQVFPCCCSRCLLGRILLDWRQQREDPGGDRRRRHPVPRQTSCRRRPQGLFVVIVATGPFRALISANMPHLTFPADSGAKIFSLTPMMQPGIELMSAQLHLFGTLYWLICRG